jgi:hypothetical protein
MSSRRRQRREIHHVPWVPSKKKQSKNFSPSLI